MEIAPLLEAITTLGDPGFILSASGGLVAALLAAGDRRTALALAVAVAASAAVTAMAKIGFMAYGPPAVYSPSGHAALATTFFFCLGVLAARASGSGRVVCGAFALAVAASRVAMGVHSLAEAMVGVAIGLCAFALFGRLAARRSAIGRGPIAACFAAAFGLQIAVGENLTFEAPLEAIAAALGRGAR